MSKSKIKNKTDKFGVIDWYGVYSKTDDPKKNILTEETRLFKSKTARNRFYNKTKKYLERRTKLNKYLFSCYYKFSKKIGK